MRLLLLPFALAALFMNPTAVRAEDVARERQEAPAGLNPDAQFLAEVDASSPRDGAMLDDLVEPENEITAGRALDDVKLRLGREPLGRLPGEARPRYGELGFAIDLSQSLSLTPSYRLNWNDDQREGSHRDGGSEFKLGAHLKF